MSGFWFGTVCTRCGGELSPEGLGKPTDIGLRVTAVTQCAKCHDRYQVVVELQPLRPDQTLRRLSEL